MLTHPESMVRILCMLMHLTSGHVTLLMGKFQPPDFFPNRTYSTGWMHVGLCPKFLVYLFICFAMVSLSSIG